MGWFESIILGIVQGLTEFIPVSSSAHVLLASRIFGWDDPGAAFTAVTQLGTEAAVLIFFRREIWTIVSTWVRSLVRKDLRGTVHAREGWYIILGTIPIGVLGLVFKDQISNGARDLRIIAATLIVLALVLEVADRQASREDVPRKGLDQLTIRDGLVYGIAQACALIPGVSRSGATISSGLFLGYTREAATRYAFLLAVPAVLVSGLYEATKIGDGDPDNAVDWGPTLLATVIAFAVGYVIIAWLLKYVSSHSYRPFVIYRIVVGIAIIVALLAGADPKTPGLGN
jgi:undecaprenyl-diphosphatase